MPSRSSFALSLAIACAISVGCSSTQPRHTVAASAEQLKPRSERTGLVLCEQNTDDGVPAAAEPVVRQVSATEAMAVETPSADRNVSHRLASETDLQQLDAESAESPEPSKPVPDEPTLTLQDLESLALTGNPTIRHANARVSA